MLKMSLLKPLCSMVLGGLQNLVFVVLEVCAEALQKTKSSEGNSIDILNINIFVDHDPTWISTSEFDEVVFLCDSLLFLQFVVGLCVCLQILHEAFEKSPLSHEAFEKSALSHVPCNKHVSSQASKRVLLNDLRSHCGVQ